MMTLSTRTGLLALALTFLAGTITRAEESPSKDIVDTAGAAGQFNTLAAALKEAGLVEALKQPGPFTVFAPTDEAFAKVPEEKLSAILKDKKLLTSILTYHVAEGKVMAREVVKLDSVKTLQGDAVRVQADGQAVRLNGTSAVVKPDVLCSNGVIHVIDTVLLPPAK